MDSQSPLARSSSLTILMLVDALNIGGVETHVLTLGKELSRRGHRIIVGTAGGPLLDTCRAAGLKTVSLPFRNDDPVGPELSELLTRTRRLIESEGVDVLHAHLISGMKIAAQAAQETTVPLILTVHGAFYPLKELRRAAEVSDRVIAVSQPVSKWLLSALGLPRERLAVVPNGIDVGLYCPGERQGFRQELGLPPEQKLVVSCGRVTWGKTRGITAAIEAIAELALTHDLHFAVVGSGSDTPLVRVMADLVNGKLNRQVVSVVDARLEPVGIYRAADVVLGTARVALEAMSCGRPVIALGNAGYVGFLRADNIEKAWKVYFGDHDEFAPITSRRLREDLDWVLRNTETVTTAAEECRRWVVENFDIERVAQATEDIYQSLVEARAETTSLDVGTPVAAPPSELGSRSEIAPRSPAAEARTVRPPAEAGHPLVSVAVSAYNRGPFLRECLEAIAAQSYRPLEVLVVDDASTDNTEEVAMDWWAEASRDPGLSFVYHRLPHNVGVARAQSMAYYLSRAAYIANQDSDDVSHPDRIALQMQFLTQNPDCSLVGTNIGVFRDDISASHRSTWIRYGHDIVTSYRAGKHCVSFGTLVFRRAVLERIGGLTSFAEGAEDWEFIARAITQGFIVDNLRQVLYFYRRHDKQRSTQYYSAREDTAMSLTQMGKGSTP